MPSKTLIYLVRHGLSEANAASIISGQVGDPSLTDEGRAQINRTKDKLVHVQFDVVYSSDLSRTSETAEIIYGEPVPHTNRLTELRERNFGSIDGLPDVHLAGSRDAQMSLSPAERWHYKHVPGMESDHELSSRYVEVLRQIAEDNIDKTVLVASHGSAIRTVLMRLGWATHESMQPGSFNNGNYAKVAYDGKNLVVEEVYID